MDIKVVEEKKNRIVLETDAGHGFCNMLKNELWADDKAKVATYSVKHPLIGKPQITVETDGTEPRKALADAAGKLKRKTEKFEKDFSKEVK